MRPTFPGVRPSTTDFQSVRDGRRSSPLYFQLNLDVARSIVNGITEDSSDVSGKALQVNAAGNSWWSDPIYDSVGNYIAGIAVAHYQDSALGAGISTPITILPNSAQRIPFTRVILENFAQAGKKLRVVYGVDIDFVPGFNAQSTIAGTVNVLEQGFAYGAAQVSAALLANGATEQVFSAASNVNGARIHAAECFTDVGAAGVSRISLNARTVAPALYTDGDVLLVNCQNTQTAAGGLGQTVSLPRAVFVAAGKGLWWISQSTVTPENVSARKVLYTLL